MLTTEKEIIKLENVTFKYKQNEEGASSDGSANGLDSVSMSIFEGEFVALVGHNGSGKSTLAKLLNGLLTPLDGTVTVFGFDTKNEGTLFEVRRRVGMVFQNPDNQMIASIVEDDIAFGPENIGVPQPEIVERVKWALSAVKMEEFSDKTPTKMSGGQKQRIAIAGVLALKPMVIVFDESTAMLDPQGRKEVIETAKRLNKTEKITVVLITHFMDEVMDADRVVVLSNGKIVMSGTPKEIFVQEKELKKIGLDVPLAREVSSLLKENGFDISDDILDIEKLGDEICQSL